MYLIDQLADITSHRDRQHADALLLATLRELLESGCVALHRCADEALQRRWLTSTHGSDSAHRRVSDTGLDPACASLPASASPDDWDECLHRLHPMSPAGEPGIMLLPLVVATKGVGVVELRSEQPLHEYMQRTAEAVVRLYGNFLALLDYGERDALTGLFNRKTFTDCFMRATLHRPATTQPSRQTQLFLAALDLDHFKRVNDTFGHLIGDEVLLLTARLMRSVLGMDEGLFRFGGEEFMVLLEADEEDEAHTTLERLREQVAQHHFPQVGRVTVSIGFTALLPDDLPTGALDRADKALYQAKADGRNRVVRPANTRPAGIGKEGGRGGEVELF